MEVTVHPALGAGAERTRTLSNRRGAAASETTAATPQPRIEQVPEGVTQHDDSQRSGQWPVGGHVR